MSESSSNIFDELNELTSSSKQEATKTDAETKTDSAVAFEKLIAFLEEEGDLHKLFDAKMMQAKWEMGLPLTQPTSFRDVPDEKRADFEKHYTAGAKETGDAFIKQGKLVDAWMYFRVIGDSTPLRDAFDQMEMPTEFGEGTDELIQLALYENVHPAKGLEMMLTLNGMCNTVTTLDQIAGQLSLEDRRAIAVLLVRQMYEDVRATVARNIEQRVPLLPPDLSLSELIAGREWLFENENYHTDVSHLNAVVRHARALEANQPELKMVVQLTQYGSQLDQSFHYPAEPPFQDFFESHCHYFNIILGEQVEESLDYFQQILNEEPDLPDQQLIAYVLIDLLMRIDRNADALKIADKYLRDAGEESGFSYPDFCIQTNQLSALLQHAKQQNDPVLYLGTQLSKEQ